MTDTAIKALILAAGVIGMIAAGIERTYNPPRLAARPYSSFHCTNTGCELTIYPAGARDEPEEGAK
jgi:hypothetical protein